MTATTLRNLLDWFATPSILQPDAVPNEQAPTYPADATPPTAEQLRGLKELLSPETWLYLLRADDATPVNELQVQRELQAHIARVLTLIGEDLRAEPLNSPRIQARFRWVQYQLLHASATQVPRVYYEKAVRAHIDAVRQQQELERLWQSLSSDQQAAYQQTSPSSAGTTSTADTPARLNIIPRTASPGDIYHPRFGEWLVQELARRPLPEIEPYLTLTWTLVTPEVPRRPGDSRLSFSLEDISYLIDLLDGDWSYQIPGGRPQLSRARNWFAKHPIHSPNDIEHHIIVDPDAATANSSSTHNPLLGLTAQQIALIHIYQEVKITTRKAEQLALQAQSTGAKKIYDKYRLLENKGNRLNTEGQVRRRLIIDIETVIVHLNGPAKKKADDELFELK